MRSAPLARVGDHSTERSAPLDGLRAIAAWSVVAYHLLLVMVPREIVLATWEYARLLGKFGVGIFFVLSGFLLYRPFVAAHFEGGPGVALRPYLVRRLARILPAYWLALTFYLYVFRLGGAAEPATVYLLLQNYRIGALTAGIEVGWTLVIELAFYLFLPLYAVAIGWLGRRRAPGRGRVGVELAGLATLVLVATVTRSMPWLVHDRALSLGAWFPVVQAHFWLPAFLDWFACGMLLAVVSAWRAAGGTLPAAVATAARVPVVCWALALACMRVAAHDLGIANEIMIGSWWQTIALNGLMGVSALLIVLPVALAGAPAPLGVRLLGSRWLAFLGAASYGTYLWHMGFIRLMAGGSTPMPSAAFVPKAAVVVALTLLASVASWRLVERPILRWAHGPRPRPAGADAQVGGATDLSGVTS